MLRLRDALICGLLGSCTPCLGSGTPGPQLGAGTIEPRAKGRQLQGRFLHITDFHPDPFYKTYSSTAEEAACHRKRGPAGYYGAETSGCDSSIALVNATMDWVKEHLADKIDFVIWTGDSARHDNDEKIPRTEKQIIEQNEFMVHKFAEVFGKGHDGKGDPNNAYSIPIVPTFGNNDVMPHNILLAGPNKWTVQFLDIWRDFVPEAQRHQFQQGGWFHVEVIPAKLAVISLNTMYFFTSNPGVDGCANKHEPGFQQFEWLRIQLQIMRDRGMNAILIGHVPPARVDSRQSWDETCWQKYALWERQYRDIIVASLFGHMNLDHFILQDFKQIKKSTKGGSISSIDSVESEDGKVSLLEDGEVTIASAADYLLDLMHKWTNLPSPPSKKNSLSVNGYLDNADEEEKMSLWQKFLSSFSGPKKKGGNGKKRKTPRQKYLAKIGGKYAERYSVSLVSPSIVPNYFPALRVLEYNITGLEKHYVLPVYNPPNIPRLSFAQNLITDHDPHDDDAYKREVHAIIKRKHKKKHKKTKKPKEYKFKVPHGPSKSSPPGPAYSPQPFTLTSYTQYFANLTYINNDFTAISMNPASPHTIFGLNIDQDGNIEARKWREGKHGIHQGKKPRPKPHPKTFEYRVEYDTKHDSRWKLKDLTVRSWVDLAGRIGKDEKRGFYTIGGESDADVDDRDEGEEKEEEVEEGNDDAEEEEKEVVVGEGDVNVEDEVQDLKKHKKHKKHKKKHGKNSAWFTFVQRAFVGSMDPRDIDEIFSAVVEVDATKQEEVMEL